MQTNSYIVFLGQGLQQIFRSASGNVTLGPSCQLILQKSLLILDDLPLKKKKKSLVFININLLIFFYLWLNHFAITFFIVFLLSSKLLSPCLPHTLDVCITAKVVKIGSYVRLLKVGGIVDPRIGS